MRARLAKAYCESEKTEQLQRAQVLKSRPREACFKIQVLKLALNPGTILLCILCWAKNSADLGSRIVPSLHLNAMLQGFVLNHFLLCTQET